MATLRTEESGRHCTEFAIMGRQGFNMTPVFPVVKLCFISKTMLCKYVTQSKYINKTEIKQKQRPTTRGMDQVS